MNKHILKTAAAALGIMFSTSLMAQLTLKEEPVNGHVMYRLENAQLSLLIDPNAGGAIVSCKDRLGGNVELVPDKEPRGMAIDHFQSQPFPGEMYSASYKVGEVKAGADQASITLQYHVTGTWRGGSDEKLKDLLLEKTFSLSKDSPALQCKVRITAPKNSSTLFAYWQQSIIFAGGRYDRNIDRSFRPSARGVRAKTAENNGHTAQETFIRDFTAGWITMLDTRAKTGMAMLTSYDDLDVLYCASGNHTMEFMYRQVFLPAGKSMEYVSWFIPVAGLDNVVSVTPDYIAGYALKGNGQTGGEIVFSAIRSINEPAALNFKIKMFSAAIPETAKEIGRIEFPTLGTEPLTKNIAFPPVGSDPLVMQAQADAGGRIYAFEDYCNGTYQWGENIQTDMLSPVYQGKRPAQKINLSKPDKLQLRNVSGNQIWYVEGLMDDYYQLSKAVDAAYGSLAGCDCNFISYGITWRSRLDGFPWDYDKLLSYDLIILGGAKREALGDTAMEMLKDYLQAGGSMLVLGGPMAYGNSRLDGTALADCLPVTFGNQPFGLECLNNAEIKVAAQAPFLEHLDWKAAPRVKYLHKVEVKP